jgi:Arc/MetJ-type ribon-helix-helix transcriptional regulator
LYYDMTITVRLDDDLERSLDAACAKAGVTRSDFIRERLREVLDSYRVKPTAHELGRDLFGRHGSGKGDLAVKHREHLADILRAQHPRR